MSTKKILDNTKEIIIDPPDRSIEIMEGDHAYAIYYDKNGRVEWRRKIVNDLYHSEDDEPAVISYYKNGEIKECEWFKNDFKHREDDEPAVISFHENGLIQRMIWYKQGMISRDNVNNREKPSVITFNQDGSLDAEHYKIGAAYSNSHGPAYIEYHNDGEIKYMEFWLNGKTYEKYDEYREAVKNGV